MLENIIISCNYVSKNSKHVTIDEEKLNLFVENIKDIKMNHWLSSSPFGLLDLSDETIINFLLIYESINFSFWGEPKWTIDTNIGKLDGSIALLYVLLQYVKESKSTDFSSMSKKEFLKILKGNIKIPLFEERFKIIKEVIAIVNDKMQGNFYQYIKDITSDIELFETIIANFPSFKDERLYNKQTIYFYKLAQLLTSDILHIREELEGIKVDYSNLIGCADYKIPQTLRALDILEYNDELSNIIDSEKHIEISSKYEVEIRASQIVVIEYTHNKLINTNPIDINDFFFVYSKKVKSIAKPYHLCRNTNY